MSNLSCTILTSAWSAFKYLDQYLFGLSQLKSVSSELDITLAFGSVSDTYDQKAHELIRERVQEVCNEAGIKLAFYLGDKSENYSQTINQLIRNTIHFTENYAIFNLDDYRIGTGLLNQIKTLQTSLITYIDYCSVNNVQLFIENSNKGILPAIEKTYESVNLNTKDLFYKEFRYGPFLAFKAQLAARFGPYCETFKSASDFDFINRMIFNDIQPVKTLGCGGAFLSISQGLSTKPDTEGGVEGYKILSKYLANRYPVNVYYNRKFLWRNL